MVATDPFALFAEWMALAKAEEINDPDAMALATSTSDGHPSVRMVLMRRHGATVAGATLQELVFRCIYGCRNAEFQTQARLLGQVDQLTPKETELAEEYNRRRADGLRSH